MIFFIQKCITCEGHFSLVNIYHIIICLHFKRDRTLNVPHYLLKSLRKMSNTIYKQQINVDKSLYHHGLTQIIVKRELHKLGIEWNKFLPENGFENFPIT